MSNLIINSHLAELGCIGPEAALTEQFAIEVLKGAKIQPVFKQYFLVYFT